jgi:hypothetical protein
MYKQACKRLLGLKAFAGHEPLLFPPGAPFFYEFFKKLQTIFFFLDEFLIEKEPFLKGDNLHVHCHHRQNKHTPSNRTPLLLFFYFIFQFFPP